MRCSLTHKKTRAFRYVVFLVFIVSTGCTTTTHVGFVKGDLLRVEKDVIREKSDYRIETDLVNNHTLLIKLVESTETIWKERKVYVREERLKHVEERFSFSSFIQWPFYPAKLLLGTAFSGFYYVGLVPRAAASGVTLIAQTLPAPVLPGLFWCVFRISGVDEKSAESGMWNVLPVVWHLDVIAVSSLLREEGDGEKDLDIMDKWTDPLDVIRICALRSHYMGKKCILFAIASPPDIMTMDKEWYTTIPVPEQEINEDWKEKENTKERCLPDQLFKIRTNSKIEKEILSNEYGNVMLDLLSLSKNMHFDEQLNVDIHTLAKGVDFLKNFTFSVSDLRKAYVPVVSTNYNNNECFSQAEQLLFFKVICDTPVKEVAVYLNDHQIKNYTNEDQGIGYLFEDKIKLLLSKGTNKVLIKARDKMGLEEEKIVNLILR